MKGQHVNSRKLAGASAASVGAATAVAALLLGTLSGSAGEEPSAAAFGIAAKGLIRITPTPLAEAPPDGHRVFLQVPGPQREREGLYIGLLKAEAERYRSTAEAAKVRILGLRLDVIRAFCDNGRGGSTIIGSDGRSTSYEGDRTERINLSPVVRVEFNRHRREGDKLTVDGAVIVLLPADQRAAAISEKDLGVLQNLVPKSMKIPTMDQLQAAHLKSSEPANSSEPTKSPVFPESAPTAGDLLSQIELLNPNLNVLTEFRDALERIVIASASCREEHKEGPPPQHQQEQAPPPHPVKTHLPVTH